LDIQYYLRYGDNSGELVFKRVMGAARRGVRVRLITDDVLLASEDETIMYNSRNRCEMRDGGKWTLNQSQCVQTTGGAT
jgi:phosphatidylserine/phosphatidylglycerophosphate/cardiolipin synthase-like enzyme